MKRNATTLVMALLLVGAVTAPGWAAPPAKRQGSPAQKAPAACQQMMDELSASDTRFQEHVKRMNETQGNERTDAMAAALNELAAAHRMMREHRGAVPCCGMGPSGRGGPGCPGCSGCPTMNR